MRHTTSTPPSINPCSTTPGRTQHTHCAGDHAQGTTRSITQHHAASRSITQQHRTMQHPTAFQHHAAQHKTTYHNQNRYDTRHYTFNTSFSMISHNIMHTRPCITFFITIKQHMIKILSHHISTATLSCSFFSFPFFFHYILIVGTCNKLKSFGSMLMLYVSVRKEGGMREEDEVGK